MKKAYYFLFFSIMCFAVIVSIIDNRCFDRNFYKIEYAKSNTAERVGVSDENLETITDVILDYLKDDRDNMDIRLEVNGKVQEVFTDRAKLHMVDVKNLYQNMISLRNITFIIAILLALGCYLISPGMDVLISAYKNVLIVLGVLFSSIGLFALIDFNTFWNGFHEIFFDNDLWLLEYNDILVNIVDSTFFFDLVIQIVAIILAFLAAVYFYLRLKKKVIS